MASCSVREIGDDALMLGLPVHFVSCLVFDTIAFEDRLGGDEASYRNGVSSVRRDWLESCLSVIGPEDLRDPSAVERET